MKSENENAVVALPADLIFAAKLRAANVSIILAKDVKDLLTKIQEHAPRLVVLDLDKRGLDVASAIAQIKAAGNAEILAYASHVREDLIGSARAAGADRVMARGAFVRQMAELVG